MTNAEAPPPADPSFYPPLDLDAPQLTVRAVVAGCLIGGVLSLSNVYAGLKIGWGFNMSITAMLIAYGFFKVASKRPFGLLENNINQTAASAAASISSAGLVAPIPAYTVLTGEKLSYLVLVVWTASASLLGVLVAVTMRKQLIIVDKLPFPGGVASAETIKQIYAHGAAALARVKMLASGAVIAGVAKLITHFAKLHPVGLPGSIAAKGSAAAAGATSYSLGNLTLALDPSLLLFGVGGIIGLRAGVSLLIGALLSWLWLAPLALNNGWAKPGALDPDAMWFGALNKWLLWPGVAMMVTSSLVSVAFSWRAFVDTFRGKSSSTTSPDPAEGHTVSRRAVLIAFVVALAAATASQIGFFDISLPLAVSAVLLSFVLALVAGRVSGETGITPVGPMGKVTQLAFGIASPGDVAGNLMAANVTGGSASQCGDLLHDLKTGALVGASPRQQAVSQTAGVLAGAVVGSAGYLLLVPDPKTMLLTPEWPAPAMAAWKAVAEVFKDGLHAMPPMALEAMVIGGAIGVVLPILERVLPRRLATLVPSAGSVGLAAVIPGNNALSMFLGTVVGALVAKKWPGWARRFTIVLAAGLIAGESLVGVGLAIWETVRGMVG